MTGCAKASVSNHMLSFTRECVRKTYHGKWVVPEMQPVLTYTVLPGAAGATGDAGGDGRDRTPVFRRLHPAPGDCRIARIGGRGSAAARRLGGACA